MKKYPSYYAIYQNGQYLTHGVSDNATVSQKYKNS